VPADLSNGARGVRRILFCARHATLLGFLSALSLECSFSWNKAPNEVVTRKGEGLGSPACAANREKVEDADRDLVVRARRGEAEAFETIVRSHQRRVYGVALRMTRRHEVADDITQETFVRAYAHLDRFQLGRPLAPWLTRIAVNLSINYLNGAAKREQPFADGQGPAADPPSEGEPDPLSGLLSSEFHRALDAAVQELPTEQRSVFVLKVHEDMSYQQIAEVLGISTGTVMSRLFRARQKLKETLRDYV
jgi:RNA polymerase sigma-70 factor, ECF subfamily